MTERTSNNQLINFRLATGASLFAGLVGLAVQILPGMDMITFMVSIAALGMLCAPDRYYTESDRQRLMRTLATALQWLFMTMFFAFCIILLLKALTFFGGAVNFINAHWMVLVMSVMCILTGIAGLRRAPDVQ